MREGHGVGVWKAIRNGWDTFKSRIRFKVVNGQNFGRISGVWGFTLGEIFLVFFLRKILKTLW